MNRFRAPLAALSLTVVFPLHWRCGRSAAPAVAAGPRRAGADQGSGGRRLAGPADDTAAATSSPSSMARRSPTQGRDHRRDPRVRGDPDGEATTARGPLTWLQQPSMLSGYIGDGKASSSQGRPPRPPWPPRSAASTRRTSASVNLIARLGHAADQVRPLLRPLELRRLQQRVQPVAGDHRAQPRWPARRPARCASWSRPSARMAASR